MLKLTKKSTGLFLVLLSIFLGACSSATTVPTSALEEVTPTLKLADVDTNTPPAPAETSAPPPTETMAAETEATSTPTPTKATSDHILADVVSVIANGNENAYTFAVEIRSPDTGCKQYGNWWEVVTQDGELVYRRILGHSHVNEQPFTRSGGPVKIGPDDVVIVRAHMYSTGYGGSAFLGSVNGGFEEIQLDADFAPELENVDPLPEGCAF